MLYASSRTTLEFGLVSRSSSLVRSGLRMIAELLAVLKKKVESNVTAAVDETLRRCCLGLVFHEARATLAVVGTCRIDVLAEGVVWCLVCSS